MVSVMVVTLNRVELAKQTVGPALKKAGVEFELLTVDNGSTDGVTGYMAELKPAYQLLNATNTGYAPAINQMLARAKGEYLCVLDPDMGVCDNWLKKLVEVNKAIPNSGISSYWCVLDRNPAQIINGCEVHPGEKVFGIKFFNRHILNRFGAFCEDYAPYGPEDADYMERINCHARIARANNCEAYIHYYLGGGDFAVHLGDDVDDKSSYRKMKWDSLTKAHEKFVANLAKYAQGEWFIPLPFVR